MMERIGPTRLKILLALVVAREHGGPLPTIRELCDALGITINAVACHLRYLVRDGLVAEADGPRSFVPRVRFITVGDL